MTVTVTSGATTVKNVKMAKGAAIGGVVKVGGKPAGGARVVAANKEQVSFETVANKQGEYALGGLPKGTYSVFTYDRRKQFVGKSTYLRKLKPGKFKRTNISLGVKAGRLVVDLYAGDQPYPGIAFVTAVSKGNGQFWTEKASKGSVTFEGLYPGKYDLVLPGAGGFLGGTLAVSGKVKKGKTSFGTVRLTQAGAKVSGTVVDGNDPAFPLSGATVTLYDGAGAILGSATTGRGRDVRPRRPARVAQRPADRGRAGLRLAVPRAGHALLQVRRRDGLVPGHDRADDRARSGRAAAPAERPAGRRRSATPRRRPEPARDPGVIWTGFAHSAVRAAQTAET